MALKSGSTLGPYTPPLEEARAVVGPVRVELWATTSAPDTDFTAKLVDVHVDGYAQNISEGIIRARYRNSNEDPSSVTPGAVHDYVIDLGHTADGVPPRAPHPARSQLVQLSALRPQLERWPRRVTRVRDRTPPRSRYCTTVAHPSRLVLEVASNIRIP